MESVRPALQVPIVTAPQFVPLAAMEPTDVLKWFHVSHAPLARVAPTVSPVKQKLVNVRNARLASASLPALAPSVSMVLSVWVILPANPALQALAALPVSLVAVLQALAPSVKLVMLFHLELASVVPPVRGVLALVFALLVLLLLLAPNAPTVMPLTVLVPRVLLVMVSPQLASALNV